MNYFAVALVSVALLLLNLGIGWILANKGARAQIGLAVRRVLHFRRKPGE
jgi:hypothetical protein